MARKRAPTTQAPARKGVTLLPEKLLTPAEVAERLSVAEITVKNWLRAGKLRGVKAGRLWRIREDDLKAYLERSGKPEAD